MENGKFSSVKRLIMLKANAASFSGEPLHTANPGCVDNISALYVIDSALKQSYISIAARCMMGDHLQVCEARLLQCIPAPSMQPSINSCCNQGRASMLAQAEEDLHGVRLQRFAAPPALALHGAPQGWVRIACGCLPPQGNSWSPFLRHTCTIDKCASIACGRHRGIANSYADHLQSSQCCHGRCAVPHGSFHTESLINFVVEPHCGSADAFVLLHNSCLNS